MYFSSLENVEDLVSANNILLVQRPAEKDESEEVRSFSYILDSEWSDGCNGFTIMSAFFFVSYHLFQY